MDGYALRGADLDSGCRDLRVTVEIPAGRHSDVLLAAGEAAKIMAGGRCRRAPAPWCPSTDNPGRRDRVDPAVGRAR